MAEGGEPKPMAENPKIMAEAEKVEGEAEEVDSRNFILADLPWLGEYSIYETKRVPLKESALGQDLSVDAMNRCLVINATFPFYIPMAHHTMSVNGIINASDERFASVAVNYLIDSKSHDQFVWNFFEKPRLPCIFDEKLIEMFGDSMPQCKKSSDFLLEPWVLIQMPFQPALFHQWLTATYAELKQFETLLIEFKYFKFNKTFANPVMRLFDTCQKVSDCLNRGRKWLNESDREEVLTPDRKKEFSDMIKHTLSFLEFWFNGGKNTIKGIKKKCFSDSKRLNHSLERNFPLTWVYLLTLRTKPISRTEEEFATIRKEIEAELDKFYMNNMNFKPIMKDYKTIIDHRSSLARAHPDIIFAQNTKYTCWDLKRRMTIEKQNSGIFGSLMTATADFEFLCASAEFWRQFCNIFKKCPSDIFLFCSEPDAPPGPELRHIVENAENWTLDSIMKRVEQDMQRHNIDKECPSITEDRNQIVSKFEARIKKIVYDSITARFYSDKERKFDKNEIVREWQMVQFLLPCYVADFADFEGHPKSRKKFLLFIHELISHYESKGCPKVSREILEKNESFVSDLTNRFAFVKYFYRAGVLFNSEIIDYTERSYKRFKYLDVMYEAMKPEAPLFLSNEPNFLWYQLILDFFEAVQHANFKVFEQSKIGVGQTWATSKIIDRLRLELQLTPMKPTRRLLLNYKCKPGQQRPVSEISGTGFGEMIELIRKICMSGYKVENSEERIPFIDPGTCSGPKLLVAILDCCKKANRPELCGFEIDKIKLNPYYKEVADLILKDECQYLEERKFLRIALYLAIRFFPAKQTSSEEQKTSEDTKPTTAMESALRCYYQGNAKKWALRRFAGDFFEFGDTIDMKYAAFLAPVAYHIPLQYKRNNTIEELWDMWYHPILYCSVCAIGVFNEDPIYCDRCISLNVPFGFVYCSAICKNGEKTSRFIKCHESLHALQHASTEVCPK